ncbi:hypothetical protein KKB99_01605 [bacterium]|nr:hypothetical protein [bacterium]
MRLIKNIILTVVLSSVIILSSCTNGGSNPTVPPGQAPDGTKVLIANSLGETFSWLTYNNSTPVIQNNVAQTGQAPNQILINGNTGYVLNSLSNSVLAFDNVTLDVIFEASVGAGKSPFNMKFINASELLITNFIANDCVRMNISASYQNTDRVIATIELPSGSDLPKDSGVTATNGSPETIVIDGATAYVSMANLDSATYAAGGPGLVAILDLNSNQVMSTIETTGRNTVGLFQDPFRPELMYIISAGDTDPVTWEWQANGKIDIFNLDTKGITRSIDIQGAPFEMAIAPTRIAYITDGMEGKLITFNTATYALGPQIKLVDNPSGLSYASGLAMGPNFLLYALEFNNDQLIVIDTSQGDVIVDRFDTGDGPDALAVIW